MMSQGLGKREVEIEIVNSPALDLAADVFTDSTKNKLTILISRLMEGDDPEALRRKYSSELRDRESYHGKLQIHGSAWSVRLSRRWTT